VNIKEEYPKMQLQKIFIALSLCLAVIMAAPSYDHANEGDSNCEVYKRSWDGNDGYEGPAECEQYFNKRSYNEKNEKKNKKNRECKEKNGYHKRSWNDRYGSKENDECNNRDDKQ
jgi:hypothetical protein